MSEIPKVKGKNKRILIFSLAYYPNVGGAEVAIKEITGRNLDTEFDLVAFNLNRDSLAFERVGNVNVYRVSGSKALYPVTAFWQARKLHRKNNYSVVWSMMAAYAGFAGLFFKSVFPKVPFLLTLQEGDSESHILKRVGIFYPIWKNIFKKANHVQVISKHLADFAKKHGVTCEVEVVSNGVDLEKFKSQKSKIESGDKILITTSRLVKKNAVDDVIKALQYLPANIKFLILGEGEEENNLRKLAKESEVESRVEFLGFVDHAGIMEYFNKADIFIRPSLSEGLGNSFLEAMAAGLPVVGTRVGGIPDFLANEETGLFCEVNNPKSIADKVTLLLSNDELRNKIIANGKKLVQEKYDWNIIAGKMDDIFDKLIK